MDVVQFLSLSLSHPQMPWSHALPVEQGRLARPVPAIPISSCSLEMGIGMSKYGKVLN